MVNPTVYPASATGADMHRAQVIGIGLPLTGSASLQKALNILGFGASTSKPSNLSYRRRFLPILNPGKPDYRQCMRDGRSMVDEASSLHVPELMTAFPHAKVILLGHESSDEWWRSWNSAQAHSAPNSYFSDHVIPALGAPTDAAWHDRHRRWVRGLVPTERLLEFNVRDGWEPLCRFLGVPIPAVPFPGMEELS